MSQEILSAPPTAGLPPIGLGRSPARPLVRELFEKAMVVFVFLVPFDAYTLITTSLGLGFGPDAAPAAQRMSLTRLVGIGVFALALRYAGSILRSQPRAFWLWVGTTSIGMLINLSIAFDRGELPNLEIGRTWQMMAILAITAYACAEARLHDRLLRALTLGLLLTLVAYVIMHVANYEVVESGGRVQKIAGFQTNQAGFHAAITVALIVCAQRIWSRKVRLVLTFVGVPLALYVLLLANSRGSWMSMLASVLALLMPAKREGWGIRIRAVAVLIAGAGLLLLSIGGERLDELIGNQTNRWNELAEKTTEREDINGVGWQLALEDPLGYGIGNAPALIGPRVSFGSFPEVDAHNEYLRMLLESGFAGAILYLLGHALLLLYAVRCAWRTGFRGPLAVLLPVQMMYATGSAYLKVFWILVGLVIGAEIAARRLLAAGRMNPSREVPS